MGKSFLTVFEKRLMFVFQVGLCSMCKCENQDVTWIEYASIILIVTAVLVIAFLTIRFLSKFASYFE